jgi:hypothetical protein
MSMVKLMRGNPSPVRGTGLIGWVPQDGQVAFKPRSYERKGSLVLAPSRSTCVCLGLPSCMYIDCNRRPPRIWIPLVALLLS